MSETKRGTYLTDSNLTPEHYDRMTNGFERPDDAKPVSDDAIRARKRAIAEGRLKAPPRDEWDGETPPEHKVANDAAADAASSPQPPTPAPPPMGTPEQDVPTIVPAPPDEPPDETIRP